MGLKEAGPELEVLLSGVVRDVHTFKEKADHILHEYFLSLSVDEAVIALTEVGLRSYRHEFVKKAIGLSLGRAPQDASREAVVTLLSGLSDGGVLSKDDLQWGVTRVLAQLDDLELDCPHVGDLAVDLLVALVRSELVSALFLRRCRLLRIGGVSGTRVLRTTQKKIPEYAKKNLSEAQFKSEVHTMLLEYFTSGDLEEVGRCVRELTPLGPEHSAELVRKAMVFAMERSGAECEQALALLVWLSRNEEVDAASLEQGFDEMYARMEDIKLDVPDAPDMANSFVVEAKKAGILRADWNDPPEG